MRNLRPDLFLPSVSADPNLAFLCGTALLPDLVEFCVSLNDSTVLAFDVFSVLALVLLYLIRLRNGYSLTNSVEVRLLDELSAIGELFFNAAGKYQRNTSVTQNLSNLHNSSAKSSLTFLIFTYFLFQRFSFGFLSFFRINQSFIG